jgi:hypothetical protein
MGPSGRRRENPRKRESLMPKLKKIPGTQGRRRKKAAEVLRYLFFAAFVAALGGMVWGARLLSHYPEEADRKREASIQQVILEREAELAAGLIQEEAAQQEIEAVPQALLIEEGMVDAPPQL